MCDMTQGEGFDDLLQRTFQAVHGDGRRWSKADEKKMDKVISR